MGAGFALQMALTATAPQKSGESSRVGGREAAAKTGGLQPTTSQASGRINDRSRQQEGTLGRADLVMGCIHSLVWLIPDSLSEVGALFEVTEKACGLQLLQKLLTFPIAVPSPRDVARLF